MLSMFCIIPMARQSDKRQVADTPIVALAQKTTVDKFPVKNNTELKELA